MFQNNPLTGFLFFIGIFLASTSIGIGSFLGLLSGTLAAYILRFDKESIDKGLYGYNGMLVGAAMAALIVPHSIMWIFAVVGGILSTIFLMLMIKHLKKIPALTYPFIFTSWILLIGGSFYRGTVALDPLLNLKIFESPIFLTSIFHSVSQVFLIESVLAGVLFLIALGVNSLPAMLFAIAGGGVASIIAMIMGLSAVDMSKGLFGFSAVLTAIALGSVFRKPSLLNALYTFFGVIVTVFMHLLMSKLFAGCALPVFTAPFVFTTWIFILARG